MHGHHQRPGARGVIVLGHVEREGAARAGRAADMHGAHALSGRIGRRKLAGQLGIVTRRGFEKELADRLQMRRQWIERFGRPRIATQRTIGRQHGLGVLFRAQEGGDGLGRRFARSLEAGSHGTQPFGPVGGA